jgi:hypothetical protein
MKNLVLFLALLLSIVTYRRLLTYEIYEAPRSYDIDLYGYSYEFQQEAKKYGLKMNNPDGLRIFEYSNLDTVHAESPTTIGVCTIWTIGIPKNHYIYTFGPINIDKWEQIEVLRPNFYGQQF